jgi:hypothetical protein
MTSPITLLPILHPFYHQSFGEQVTKQYLSESINFRDYLIFAIAPMGILTALVSAIRVCGSPSLCYRDIELIILKDPDSKRDVLCAVIEFRNLKGRPEGADA